VSVRARRHEPDWYDDKGVSNFEENWLSAQYQEYFIGQAIKLGNNSLKLVECSISRVFQRSSDQIWKEFTVHSGGPGGGHAKSER